jgi:tRNA(Ile2) C34 agmatinyltransferase TiaS
VPDTIVILLRDSNGQVGVAISPPTDDMSDEETTALTQQLLVDGLVRVTQGNKPKCPDCGEVHEQ